jgi:hypothetical protein
MDVEWDFALGIHSFVKLAQFGEDVKNKNIIAEEIALLRIKLCAPNYQKFALSTIR